MARAVEIIELRAIFAAVTRIDVGPHGELEQELAVLGLADLQERKLVGGADVVALGIDEEDLRALAGDLPAEDERRRCGATEGGLVGGGDLAAQSPEVLRRLEEVADRGQALAVAGEITSDAIEHLVGGRQAAG